LGGQSEWEFTEAEDIDETLQRHCKEQIQKNPKSITALGVFEFVKSVLVLTFAF
jgi:hypothetical protein